MYYPCLDRLAVGINKSKDTKEAIIFCVETNQSINKKIKKMEQKAWDSVNKKLEYFKFDKNDIPSIVLNRDKERE